MAGPLHDLSVLITRGRHQATGLAEAVKAFGAVPVMVPLVDFSLPENVTEIRSRMKQLGSYDWVVLTSQNGVDFFFRLAAESGIQHFPKFAVIGSKTKKKLEDLGHQAEFVPQTFVAESFAEEFLPMLQKEERVLVAKGNLSRDVIAKALRQEGIPCEELILYKTFRPRESERELSDLLNGHHIDLVTFTSSSTVTHFMEAVDHLQLRGLLEGIVIACIGPVTKQAALDFGLTVHICPDIYTTDAMVGEIIAYIESQGGIKR
ncbi:uroporphyrinogen-III synthase [Bacillus massiliglaciei]|uniref:uroporphyrinogen-III synthase n=1 Tax=Bacillus massiliglaciei TaxID=1816693 RepID=UPI000DA5FA6E|nr:uroporphyrinogen-III synthase [Bacillus massiliglaciei]